MRIHLNDIELLLLPQKALYLPKYKMLCIADWHLGKAAHFRKHGIIMPQPKQDKGFSVLENLMKTYDSGTILFIGDLFHSTRNNEWNAFHTFVRQHTDIDFILVKGNHDIIPDELFHNIGVQTIDEIMLDNKLVFTHHPLYKQTPTNFLNIAGHVHPACIVEQKARQTFRLPCFYYRPKTLLVPSFGEMTGMHVLKTQPDDLLFPIFYNEVMKL